MLLFNAFQDTVKNYSGRLALNHLTYQELLKAVLEHDYRYVCDGTDWTIILDILKASMLNKPIVILPKFNRESAVVPAPDNDGFGIMLFSSGSSSGNRKCIFMSDRMIMSNAKNATKCQSLTFADTILTVCSLNHTGGLSAQTIAGLLTGSHIIVEQFNAFNFLRLIAQHNVTVTHLIPVMINALIKVNSDTRMPSLRLVMAGSDCVNKEHVEYWLSKGVPFIVNYGMTEAGPIIINHKFSPGDDLTIFSQGVPLGTTAWCQVAVSDGILKLKGSPLIVNNVWFDTGDCVEQYNEWFLYKGRRSAGCKIIPKQY
jgi:acyl-coenzyme A synthetase/AMP-(fatty) acid ligase